MTPSGQGSSPDPQTRSDQETISLLLLTNPKINNYSKIFYVLHLALLLEVVEVDPVVKTLQKEGFPKKKVSHLNFPKLLLTQEHMLKPTDVNLKVTKFILFQP